jgi:methylated-DNA-[protein]-cysteine S-methyltransferase
MLGALLAHLLFHTPLGVTGLAYSPDGIVAIALPSQTETATQRAVVEVAQHRLQADFPHVEPEVAPTWVQNAVARIAASLGGRAISLRELPLDRTGFTEFRSAIYEAARDIERGARVSYAELAARAGRKTAARAVGRAMATNPTPILVPCHRVVDSRGQLHGFSAPGGVRTKALLLSLEAEPQAPRRQTGRPQRAFDF